MKNALEVAIIKTLAYADLFNQALTIEELGRLMIGYKLADGEKLSSEVRNAQYKVRDGIWILAGREALFDLKTQQLQTTNQKLQTAKRYVWLFRLLPWVKLVAVTGSVAGGSPKIDDDIDLVVVTARNRLWLSRFFLTGFLTLIGKRRKPTDDPARVNNKLCLNMWVSEEFLGSEHQDVYVANELAHMVPLLNRDAMYERYVQANAWVKNVLPNFYGGFRVPGFGFRESARLLAYSPTRLLNWLDSQLEHWQMELMRPRTKEIVKDGVLMFHPKDYRSEVLKRYEERLKELGITG